MPAQTAPYGSWKSPLTSDLIVSGSIGLGAALADGADLYWLEMRPLEEGRLAPVRRSPDGTVADALPPPWNVRTRVHEYGGGAYAVADGTVYFSNFADQRLYRLDPGSLPRPLTPAVDLRYADGVVDRRRNLLYCVREDHTAGGEAVNTLVALSLDGDEAGGRVLVSGSDFYSTPRLSPDGSRLCWLSWNHPNMPWDGTTLWVADVLADGTLGTPVQVAGGPEESIFQPAWSPDGVLHLVSDRSGWWNLYRWRGGALEPLCPMEAEFGRPQWAFGMSMYGFDSAGRIVCVYIRRGESHLAALDPATGRLTPLPLPYTDLWGLSVQAGRALFVGASPTLPPSLLLLDLSTGTLEVLRRSYELPVDPAYLAIPEEIEFPTEHGRTAYGFFYRPRNPDFVAPEGERPPLLVMSHGGPTGATTTALDMSIQYWTSRGIAVLDVNYGGSTGYGREYRRRLNGQWGVVDVDDCVNGARFLVERGDVDGQRLAITGGSAGGYTTLCALTFRDLFKAGASHFGIGDLETFVHDTHKFESRYLERLIGPWPESADLYHQRSPIHFTDRLSTPMILFQGLEDKIVPPNQSETMFATVKAKGLPVAYVPFAGEQHGFRRAENIKRALDGELYFYSRIFGFALADPVEPVPIENLD